MHSFVSSARREWRRLRQRPWDLAMITWIPLLGAWLMWWIFSAGLSHNIPIAVMDEDHTALSRQITRYLDASPGLRVLPFHNAVEAEQSMRRMETMALVTLPRDLEADVQRGGSSTVVFAYNAQFGTHAGNITRDVRTVISTVSAGIEMRSHALRGGSAATEDAAANPLLSQQVSLFNVSSNFERFLAIALIPALLHILAVTAGAWCVGVELRDCSIRGWLPEKASLFEVAGRVAGKLLWPWVGLSCTGLMALVGMTWGRSWHPAGHIGWVAMALMVFLALSLVAGAALAAVTRSLRTGLSSGGLVAAPAFAFSGVGFPTMAMPSSAQKWSQAMPYTHYARLQTEQLLMGAPVAYSVATVMGMLIAIVVLWALTSAALLRARHASHTWGRR